MHVTVVVVLFLRDHGQVWDKTELQRTLFFPGLGWLLTRRLYEEVRSAWYGVVRCVEVLWCCRLIGWLVGAACTAVVALRWYGVPVVGTEYF